MKKDTYYFSHDYNARNDSKIKKLISRHGIAGYGIYWAIIEDLYNNTNVLPTDYESIAYDLRTEHDTILSIINDFDLFVFDGKNFGSLSVQKRLDERKEKSENAKNSVLKRWANKGIDTNVLQSNYEPNTIKERKVNKKKGKEIIEKLIFIDGFKEIVERWLKYKLDRKENYKSEDSIKTFYNSLLKLSNSNPKIAIDVIEQSISNNWAGIFELKNNQQKADDRYEILKDGTKRPKTVF